jgi:hypothetical protein
MMSSVELATRRPWRSRSTTSQRILTPAMSADRCLAESGDRQIPQLWSASSPEPDLKLVRLIDWTLTQAPIRTARDVAFACVALSREGASANSGKKRARIRSA